MQSQSATVVAPAGPPEPPPGRPAWPARRLVGWLVVAWVGPLLAYAAGLAGLLPLVLLGLTAGLLRGGRTLLDRLVLAGALLAGATCAAGLLFSAWPWGLHPVPVAGTASTVLLGIAAATGRRPGLPRPVAADALPVGAALLAAVALAWPYLRAGDLAGRLAYAMTGEDNSRHLATVEGIRAVGGYLFTDPQAAARIAPEPMVWYPQGFHLTAALLDTFLRSSTAPAGPADALDHYLGWSVGAWGLLVLAVTWTAQRLAGPWLDLPRALALTGAVTAACLGSELARFVVYGYPGESLGLAAAVLLVAVTCRPVARTGTQVAVVGALCVTVGFAYLMFLPVVAALVAAWLVRDRRRLRRRPRLLAVAMSVAAVLTPLPAVAGLLRTDQVDNVATGGGVFPRYDAFLALVGLVGAGLVAGRRLPVWRRYAGALAAAGVFAAGFLLYFRALGTDPRYYYGKTLHLLLAVLLVGAGALALLLPPPGRTVPGTRAGGGTGRRTAGQRAGARWAVAVALVAACAGAAGLPRGTGLFAQPFGDRVTTWAAAWWSGSLARPGPAASTARALARPPAAPGTVTVVVSDRRREGYLVTLFVSTLQGTAGASGPAVYRLPLAEPARSAAVVAAVPGPIRFLAADAAAARIVEDLLAARPELRERVSVERLP
ncbi:hypothetical protein [Micromonospora sp. WMMD712]|uniref:hypothetical protein n=1 Tax=Micromonospora sp. WMMD712 TaxID=3016096 RepID=UPI00249A8E2C|nr:hypothetical protein [Micromonospora sp. WMMD712]WFE60966.1 hypothetical protein O7633_30840 [Micromonospora sp. WMMD712]